VQHDFHCSVDAPVLRHCPRDGPLVSRPR
jgi:hypothetical protein